MKMRVLMLGLAAASLTAIAIAAEKERPASEARGQRVFELRTYYTHKGKLGDLHKRFREHTCQLFQKHGIELVGFWTPQDEKDGRDNKLVYLIAFPSRDAAQASWKAFHEDPEWQKVFKESHADGPIVEKVDSVFLDPTDYSPIK